MSLVGWIRCWGAGGASSSARPLIVFSSVPPLLCAFGSCTLNRTSWTTRDHLQETRQFAMGCPIYGSSPYFFGFTCNTGSGYSFRFIFLFKYRSFLLSTWHLVYFLFQWYFCACKQAVIKSSAKKSENRVWWVILLKLFWFIILIIYQKN